MSTSIRDLQLIQYKTHDWILFFSDPENRTEENYKKILESRSDALDIIPQEELTEQMLIELIIRIPLVFEKIKNKTENLCIEVCKHAPSALRYIKNPTTELCLKVISLYPSALKYIKHPTKEMYDLAFKKSTSITLQYLNGNTDISDTEYYDMIKDNLQICLPYATRLSEEMRMDIIIKNKLVSYYNTIKNPTEEFQLQYVRLDPGAIKNINNPVNTTIKTLYIEAIKAHPSTIRFLQYQPTDLCLLAVTHDGLALEYIKNKTPEIIMAALKQNVNAIKYVPRDKQTLDIANIVLQQDPILINFIDPKFIKTTELHDETTIKVRERKYYIRCICHTDASSVPSYCKTKQNPLDYIKAKHENAIIVDKVDKISVKESEEKIYIVETNNTSYDVYQSKQVDKVIKGWLSETVEKEHVMTKLATYELINFE